jgi:predicted PurR-regulated permease PerM
MIDRMARPNPRNTVSSLDSARAETTTSPQASSDITRVVLFVLVIGTLLAGSLWTLLPFLSGLIWATTIVIATWPALLRLERLFGGRRSMAVAVMTLAVLLTFIVPFVLAIGTLIDAAQRSPVVLNDFLASGLRPPPAWISQIPFVGADIADAWHTIAAGGPEGLRAAVQPYAGAAAAWAMAAIGGLGRMIVLILLTSLLVAILYSRGEVAARGALALARRLGGETGERTMHLAGQAIRSVALGVVLTALVQSLLVGLGLWVCGIPHAGVLTALAFMLGIAQIGPLPVLALSVIWLYSAGSAGWGTALLIWTVPVAALDNVLRPVLIRRGVQLPLLLIIGGVIGGLISFGVVGLFVGPVVLAATYTLAKDWVARGRSEAATQP